MKLHKKCFGVLAINGMGVGAGGSSGWARVSGVAQAGPGCRSQFFCALQVGRDN